MFTDIRDIILEGQSTGDQISAYRKVVEYIKSKIVYREWKAGDRLPTEPELCKLINVSRSAVREAIKILEASNIVQIRRGDGTYISDSSGIAPINPLFFRAMLQDVSDADLDAFRDAIELEVLRMGICKATSDDIEKLNQAYIAMEETVETEPDNHDKMLDHEVIFHTLLADIARNLLLRDTYLSIMDIYFPLILRNYQIGQGADTGLSTHRLIVDALENRDLIAAGHAIINSVDLCSDWVQRARQKDESNPK